METINVLSSVIIFLYLVIIFLVKYYENSFYKKNTKKKFNIKKLNPTIPLYCIDLISSNKLFWITVLELIKLNYYKLTDDYILKKGSKYKELELENYQKDVTRYIDLYLNKSIEEINNIVRGDINYSNIQVSYMNNVKKYTRDNIGRLDRVSPYIVSIICTFLYSYQVAYFLVEDINFVGKVLIALPFSYITVLISNLFKNKFRKHSALKCILFFLVSLLVSLLTSSVWNSSLDNDYIIFHFIMGVFTYMYPLLIFINVYMIRTNINYKNKLQQDIIEEMTSDDNKDYIYSKILKQDVNKTDKIVDKYFEILDI